MNPYLKERTFNERTLNLNTMIKISFKYFPAILPILRQELEQELNRIKSENRIRQRSYLIKKR